jgi:hypothetical protein
MGSTHITRLRSYREEMHGFEVHAGHKGLGRVKGQAEPIRQGSSEARHPGQGSGEARHPGRGPGRGVWRSGTLLGVVRGVGSVLLDLGQTTNWSGLALAGTLARSVWLVYAFVRLGL